MIGLIGFSWLLILAQVFAFYWFQVGFFGRAAASGILLIATIPQIRLCLSKQVHALLLVLAGVVFASNGMSQLMTRGIYGLFGLLSEYLLLVQALELVRDPRPATANYVPGLSILTFSMLLLSIEEGLATQTIGYLCAVFFCLLVCVLRPDLLTLWVAGTKERNKAKLLFMILGASLMSGWLFENELNRNLPQLRRWIDALNLPGDDMSLAPVNQQKARMVDQAGLGAFEESRLKNQEELVFSVTSNDVPGYMRTMAFSDFDGIRWQNPWASSYRSSNNFRTISSTDQAPDIGKVDELQNGVQLFELAKSVSGELEKYIVEVPAGRGKLLPLTLNPAYVFGVPNNRLSQIQVDPHGSIVRLGLENTNFGILAGDTRADSPDQAYIDSLLRVPRDELRLLEDLADRICAGASKNQDKIAATQKYFYENFKYSLRSKPDANLAGRSRLEAFLTERREAHCEYFATACALLLRTQGIPCRLAIGYLVYEKSVEGDYFVALNRNAHAWVEAYDRTNQSWVIVESTPTIPEYIESHRPELDESASTDLQAQTSGSQSRLEFSAVFNELLFGIQQLGLSFFSSRFAWLLPLGLAALFLLLRYGPWGPPSTTQRVTLSRAIRQADRLANRYGYCRRPSETCCQFARRISSSQPELGPLADWYQQFSSIRYTDTSSSLPRLPRIDRKAARR